MTKRVLVTGASGFLGRHLCNALFQHSYFVLAMMRDRTITPSSWNASATVFGGFEQVERSIAEYEIDTVVHLAAQTQVSTAVADPVGTLEANVRGTWQVLEACRRQKIKRIIVASSDKAYGDWVVPYTEAQPLVPGGIYATSKLMTDSLAQSYEIEYGMPIAITRCGNIYGPGHMNWSTLIPGTIRSVIEGEAPVLRSNGGPKRDFTFIDDVVEGYLRLINSDARGPFNFGTGEGQTVMDVVKEILHLMKSDLHPVIRLGEVKEIKDQILDSSKAREILGWEPKHRLTDGLNKTINWYRGYISWNKGHLYV